MLSSTKRRILNIICVSLAIIAMGIGLGMKYTERSPDQVEISELPASEKYDLLVKRDSINRLRSVPEISDPN